MIRYRTQGWRPTSVRSPPTIARFIIVLNVTSRHSVPPVYHIGSCTIGALAPGVWAACPSITRLPELEGRAQLLALPSPCDQSTPTQPGRCAVPQREPLAVPGQSVPAQERASFVSVSPRPSPVSSRGFTRNRPRTRVAPTSRPRGHPSSRVSTNSAISGGTINASKLASYTNRLSLNSQPLRPVTSANRALL